MGRDGAHEAKRASHGRAGEGQMPADPHSDTYVRPGRFPDPHEGAVRSVRDVLAAAIHPRRFETERHGGAWNETERTCGGKPNQPPIRICFSSVNDERSPPHPPIPTVVHPTPLRRRYSPGVDEKQETRGGIFPETMWGCPPCPRNNQTRVVPGWVLGRSPRIKHVLGVHDERWSLVRDNTLDLSVQESKIKR